MFYLIYIYTWRILITYAPTSNENLLINLGFINKEDPFYKRD